MPVDPVRDAAIDVLLRVSERRTHLDVSLDKTLKRKRLSGRGARFLTQLVYGTVRHQLLADHILREFLHQSLETLPLPILLVLRMGVFQSLFCNQVTFPSMVHTSVDLAKKRGHIGTSRLVNAVLKRVPETLEDAVLPDEAQDPMAYLSVRYSTPPWLVQKWADDFGIEKAGAICEACNEEAPRTLRVNTRLTTAGRLQETLLKAGTPTAPHPDIPDALVVIEGPMPLKGKAFQNGLFFPQDPASMLAAHLVAPQAGEHILDLCAAPGGKATHLAELAEEAVRIVATEIHRRRLYLLDENCDRLKLTGITPVVADGRKPPFGCVFDRVLVDAPCTGLGTIRRHPDLKWRIGSGDAQRLAKEQTALLRSAIGLCKNNGLVVYSVCTFNPEETVDVIAQVMAGGKVGLEDGPEWAGQWKIQQGQYRILPEKGRLDGYFLTRLRKAS